jgi:signal transduction protein with GAF and PtsI domain/anti-sigma regulatory factor (Ser/Thr protein kinase)
MDDLEQKLSEKTAQLAALREIGRAINAAWELEATLELITRKTAEVMNMDSCSIYLLDAAGECLVLQATTGLAAESVGRASLRLGEGLTGWAAKMGRPVAVADAAKDSRFKYLPETGETVFQSLLAVALINQGRVIGAMNVQTRALHHYGADEVELLSLIADLAAGALEKAVLHDKMHRQIVELTTLAEVSEAVTSPLYLDEMLALVVDMAAQVMQAKACSLMLLDEKRNELVLHAMQNLSPAYARTMPLRVGEGIAGRVVQTGQPMVVEDVRVDPRYHHADVARGEGLCSLLCVPLRLRERTIGTFSCYTSSLHHFTEEEMALFATLANQTALAIENARLVTNVAVVREMHHRIKNNLQSVAMLLRMQMTSGREVVARDVLQEAINRIQSIAAVHEILSQKGFTAVEIKELINRISQAVLENMSAPHQNIRISVEGVEFALPSQAATSLALAVNELVQNAVQHAFAGRKEGAIAIQLAEEPSHWRITIRDNGVGLPSDSTRHMGLELVEELIADDLRGEFSLAGRGEGTGALLRIPKRSEE